MPRQPLTVRQAAQRLGVIEQRVRQLIAAGDLDATRFGRAWAIDPRSVDREARRRARTPDQPRRGRPPTPPPER